MMPALALTDVLAWEVIRAVIEPSPERDCQANWNWSVDPKMSAPAALTVKVAPAEAADPAIAGDPTSAQLQPVGHAATDASAARAVGADAARPGAAPALQETSAATTATTVVMVRNRRTTRRRPAERAAGVTAEPD